MSSERSYGGDPYDMAGATSSGDEVIPLPDPTPLKAARTPAKFPTDALPGWAGDWVDAEAVATQTPEDLAGVCVLGVLSAAASGRVVVQARPGWVEPCNLYLLPVMPPGTRKSAVNSAATRPLYDAEKALVERVRAQIAEAVTLKDVATKAAEKALRTAANADGARRHELTADAVSAARAAEEIDVPVVPRLVADDVTPEAVGSLLAAHGGRLAIISAEGGVFETMAGRYSNGVPNLDVWLKGHAGDQLRVDRKGRPSEYVPRPALTLLLTVQPAVLAGIARNGTFRGRGLTARFLYALPPDNVGRRTIGAPPVPEHITGEFEKRVRELVLELADWDDPAVLRLTADAHEQLLGLERAIEPRLLRDGELGSVREWASKLVGAVVRIAGLLHLAEGDGAFRRPIGLETLQAAIRFASYFIEHAQAAFNLLGDGGAGDAMYVLEFLRRRQVERFTIRSLHVDLPRGRFGTAEDVTAAVEVLVEHGWIILTPPPPRTGAGRPPSPGYRSHPSALDDAVPFTGDAVATQSTQSTESPTRRGFVDSVDSVATSTGAHCIGCSHPIPEGAKGCSDCYKAGRVA